MSARELVAALGGRWHGSYGAARCPAHDDRSPSLSVREGDTAPLLTCHAGCERSAVVDALKARGLWEGRERQHRSARPATRPTAPEQHRNQDCALAIWRECEPSAGTVTETYLRGRRITIAIPPTLRYHRCLKHYETGLTFPALVAGVQGPHRGIIAVQRIYLLPDGRDKARVSKPKLSLGPLADGAVRLAAAGRVLGIAEGIETALSAMQLFGVPVWVSLGAGRMKCLGLPREVERVVIFGDRGKEGEAAAHEAADVFAGQGRHVEGRFPAEGFGDWNDALRQRRTAA